LIHAAKDDAVGPEFPIEKMDVDDAVDGRARLGLDD
jgi:hypothetical protein